MTYTLDLGCGPNPKNPFNAKNVFGIDIRSEGDSIKAVNLFLESIPFPENHFDYVSAFDFIEHIPRVLSVFDNNLNKNVIINPFVNLMNEIWRVLKPNGIFLHKTPVYPSLECFQDPTHVNFITPNTMSLYFNSHYPVANIYGFIGGFNIISSQIEGSHLIEQLSKSQSPDLSKFGSIY